MWDGVTGTITLTRRPVKKTTKPKARKVCVWKCKPVVGYPEMGIAECFGKMLKGMPHAVFVFDWWTFCPNCGRKIERKK